MDNLWIIPAALSFISVLMVVFMADDETEVFDPWGHKLWNMITVSGILSVNAAMWAIYFIFSAT